MEQRLPESPGQLPVRPGLQAHSSEVTAEEAALAALLECAFSVLHRPVAPDEHFLNLGGNSLTALRLVALLGARGYQLDVGEIFEQDDMAALARQMFAVEPD